MTKFRLRTCAATMKTAALIGATFFDGPAQAQATLSLPVALGQDGSVSGVRYSCADGTKLSVQYVNAGANSLALIPLKGETLIFVGVVSGSGARYASGARIWWTKGDEATLSDEMGDAQPVTCAAAAKK